MKKLVFTFLLSLLAFIPVLPAHAQSELFPDCQNSAVSDSSVCADRNQDQSGSDNSITGPAGVLSRVADIVLIVVGAAAVVVIIIGGFQMIYGVGDASKIAEGRNAILYALIGVVVAVIARTIVRFVVNRL